MTLVNLAPVTGKNVKLIFRNALHYYNKVLMRMKSDKDFEFSPDIIQVGIEKYMKENSNLIELLETQDGLNMVGRNRIFLCNCLKGYLSSLEITKSSLITKLHDNLSLPMIDATQIDEEITTAKSVLIEYNCENNKIH
jgi:hypothetical protein